MVIRRLAAMLFCFAVPAAACNALVPNEEPVLADDAPDGSDAAVTCTDCDAPARCVGDCEPCAVSNSCGACGHTCLGGSCDGGHCEPVAVAPAQHVPSGLAVDRDVDGYVYWTVFEQPGHVLRKSKSSLGAPIETVYAPAASTGETPTELAVDAAHLYWTSNDFGGTYGSIHWANKDGTDHHRVKVGGFGAGVAVDSAAIYWTARGPGGVWRLPFGGDPSAARALFLEPAGGGDRSAFDIAVEPGAAGSVFWTDSQSMNRIAKGGSDQTQLGPAYPPSYGGPLAISNTELFSTGPTGRILVRTDKSHNCPGASVCPHVLAGAAYVFEPHRLVIDGVNVYWGNNGDGRIVRCKLDGSDIAVLAVGQGNAYGLAVDDVAVYWTVQYPAELAGVWRVAK